MKKKRAAELADSPDVKSPLVPNLQNMTQAEQGGWKLTVYTDGSLFRPSIGIDVHLELKGPIMNDSQEIDVYVAAPGIGGRRESVHARLNGASLVRRMDGALCASMKDCFQSDITGDKPTSLRPGTHAMTVKVSIAGGPNLEVEIALRVDANVHPK